MATIIGEDFRPIAPHQPPRPWSWKKVAPRRLLNTATGKGPAQDKAPPRRPDKHQLPWPHHQGDTNADEKERGAAGCGLPQTACNTRARRPASAAEPSPARPPPQPATATAAVRDRRMPPAAVVVLPGPLCTSHRKTPPPPPAALATRFGRGKPRSMDTRRRHRRRGPCRR
jgi:hypothetical protein